MVYYGKLKLVKPWFTIAYYGTVPRYTTVLYQGKLWCRTMVNYGTIPWYCTMDYFSHFSTFLLKIFIPIHIPPFQAAVAGP